MRLVRARRDAGLTQQDLSRRSGVPQSVISDIENGKTAYPRVDTAIALARVLDCTVDELFDNEKAAGNG